MSKTLLIVGFILLLLEFSLFIYFLILGPQVVSEWYKKDYTVLAVVLIPIPLAVASFLGSIAAELQDW